MKELDVIKMQGLAIRKIKNKNCMSELNLDIYNHMQVTYVRRHCMI